MKKSPLLLVLMGLTVASVALLSMPAKAGAVAAPTRAVPLLCWNTSALQCENCPWITGSECVSDNLHGIYVSCTDITGGDCAAGPCYFAHVSSGPGCPPNK